MEPALGVAALWLVFGGTHIALTTRRVRGALVARLGEAGFLTAFSIFAALSFTVLIRFYAAHRFDGAAGPALGAAGPARAVLIAAVFLGFLMALANLVSYPGSAYVIGGNEAPQARGLDRITRHPFFVGIALASVAHALLAGHLVGTVFFVCLAGLALGGAWHQDRKLLARRGAPFAAFLATTSLVPFAAIVSGRQRLVLRELPWAALVGTAVVLVGLRQVHASIFAHGGAWVIGVVVGSAAILGGQGLIALRRHGEPGRLPPRGAPNPLR